MNRCVGATTKTTGVAESRNSLVTYADPAIAEAAIEQLNNVELGGRPIHIRLDRKEVEASGGFPGRWRLNHGLDPFVGVEELYGCFFLSVHS